MRENLFRLAFIILLALTLLLSARSAVAQTLTVTPAQCLAPCNVRVQLRIERNKANRWWSIAYTGPEEGSSGGTLDGEDSEAVFPVCTTSNYRGCYRTLRSDGTYLFIGCVHKMVDGKIKPYCDEKGVNVRGPWKPHTSVSSAKPPYTLTVTVALGSAASSATRCYIGVSAIGVKDTSWWASRNKCVLVNYRRSTRLERRGNEKAQYYSVQLRSLSQFVYRNAHLLGRSHQLRDGSRMARSDKRQEEEMKDQIVYSVTFHCAKCKSNDLQSPGAVRTLAERLYLVFTCGECGSSVPIEIDKIIAELYKKPLGSDSGSVN